MWHALPGRNAPPDALINPDRREWIATLAGTFTIAQVAALLRAIGETLQHIDRNVTYGWRWTCCC